MFAQRIPQDVYSGNLTIVYCMKCDKGQGYLCLCAIHQEFVMRGDGEKGERKKRKG